MMITPANFKQYANSTTYKIEAKESDYLYVQGSQIPGSGNGLFTAIPIYKDEVISVFKGKILSVIEAEQSVVYTPPLHQSDLFPCADNALDIVAI